MHQFANMPMTTQSRMQQIDTLANYPMGTKPDSFRLIKKTFKSGEPMKTKIICFIAFVSYTFYLTAGDIYVSPYAAVVDMLTSSRSVMERNGLDGDSIDYFVPHQANLRIIEAISKRMDVPEEKVLVNIVNRGNTSAASIPLCLDENRDKLKPGDKIVMTAFGAGFTWGAMYIIWSL